MCYGFLRGLNRGKAPGHVRAQAQRGRTFRYSTLPEFRDRQSALAAKGQGMLAREGEIEFSPRPSSSSSRPGGAGRRSGGGHQSAQLNGPAGVGSGNLLGRANLRNGHLASFGNSEVRGALVAARRANVLTAASGKGPKR